MHRVYKFITISGPSNAGKTTVSDLLIQILPKTVKIELDNIGHTAKVLPHKDRGSAIFQDAAAVAVNWMHRGFDVILLGALWGIEPLQAALGQRWGDHPVDYYSFILAPPLEIALHTRGPRTLSEKDRDWIRQTYEWNLHAPGFGIVIDNQDQTPEQTAALIADYIRNRRTEKPHDS